jgi:uncharacterized membrane protein
VIGIAGGAIGFAVAALCGALATFAALIAWDTAVAIYLALTWRLFLTAKEADVRARCARQDEQRWVILILVLVAVGASLAAIVGAMLEIKQLPHGQQAPVAGLAILTLIGSWALLQTVFALHYAHEHFQDVERRGEAGGIAFPGEPARTYLDFVYLAVCVGATGQVSDPNITTGRLRNLVTAHGVTAFFYNTAVLALGINILASLLSA